MHFYWLIDKVVTIVFSGRVYFTGCKIKNKTSTKLSKLKDKFIFYFNQDAGLINMFKRSVINIISKDSKSGRK
jgi:hypothetical protein